MIIITIAVATTTYVYVAGTKGPSNLPHLKLQITPTGYPQQFDKWEIMVWKFVNGTYIKGDNVTILVEINNQQKNNVSRYQIATDVNGMCEFTYLEKETYKFTAFAKGFQNDSFEPDIIYIKPENISPYTSLFTPLSFFIMFPIITVLLGYQAKRTEKMKEKSKINMYIKMVFLISILIIIFLMIGSYLTIQMNATITSFGYPKDQNLYDFYAIFLITIILIIIFVYLSFYVLYVRFFKKNK